MNHMEDIRVKISSKVEQAEACSPFLFIGSNTELLNTKVKEEALQLLRDFWVPQAQLFILEDNGENIKIQDIKRFVKPWELSTPYKFQIFLIENIARMTLQSFNSCLKFFEEPGIQNLIFCTNKSEAWVIDTILSRVQVVDLWLYTSFSENSFYFSLLEGYHKNKTSEIFSYFYRNKLEKHEYLDFLKSMIAYSKKHFVFLDFLLELEEDINLIEKNNVNAKYVVDKYLLKI